MCMSLSVDCSSISHIVMESRTPPSTNAICVSLTADCNDSRMPDIRRSVAVALISELASSDQTCEPTRLGSAILLVVTVQVLNISWRPNTPALHTYQHKHSVTGPGPVMCEPDLFLCEFERSGRDEEVCHRPCQ